MNPWRPWLAFVVYLGIGILVAQYGLRDGSIVLADLACGILLYYFLASLLPRR